MLKIKCADWDRMSSKSSFRVQALEDLVNLRRSVGEAVSALVKFSIDSEEELIDLTPVSIMTVLDKYLSGDLSAQEVELWAETLYMRDDVGLQEKCEGTLKMALFELSSPEINEPITYEVALDWKARLRSCLVR